jgi:hypothetical protein
MARREITPFDRKVAALRKKGVAPKALPSGTKKSECTPLQWAGKLEYQNMRKKRPGVRARDNAVVRAWKAIPENNARLAASEKQRLHEQPESLARKRKNNRERMRRLRQDPTYLEWFDKQGCRREYMASYNRIRRASDPMFAIANRLRSRLNGACNSKKTERHWSAMSHGLATIGDLRDYLESRFLSGMSWQNRDQWHVDHWMPMICAEVDLTLVMHQRAICHYTNLRPLWDADNISRGNEVTAGAYKNFLRLVAAFEKEGVRGTETVGSDAIDRGPALPRPRLRPSQPRVPPRRSSISRKGLA